MNNYNEDSASAIAYADLNENVYNHQVSNEELISNFRHKYDELRYILQLKTKEIRSTEIAFNEILNKMNNKLDELEEANRQLRSFIILNKNENDELKIEISELKNKFVGDKHLMHVYKSNNKTSSENDDHTQTPKSLIHNRNLSDQLNFTRNELDLLKEKFTRKYNFVKEKYSLLKHQNREKDETIKMLKNKIENLEQEKNNNFNFSSKEILKLEENYKNIINKKDHSIQNLLKYKNLIDEELKIIKQILNGGNVNGYSHNTGTETVKTPNYKYGDRGPLNIDTDFNENKIKESVGNISNVYFIYNLFIASSKILYLVYIGEIKIFTNQMVKF